MYISYNVDHWELAASAEVQLVLKDSINLEDIPAPLPIDARLIAIEARDNCIFAKYQNNVYEDDLVNQGLTGPAIIYYRWTGRQWLKL
jgi:hypothetical protein